jgi:hypothetical protein
MMATTWDDLAQIYIAAGLEPPTRFVGSTDTATAADVAAITQQVQEIAATGTQFPGGTGTTGGTSTGTTTTGGTSTGTVAPPPAPAQGTASVADVEALFAAYGLDPTVHFDGSVEQTRAIRLANQLNSGQITWNQLTQTLATAPGATAGGGTGTSGPVTVDTIRAIFNEAGIPIATAGETEMERLNRLVSQINSGQRTLAEVTTAIQTVGGNWDPSAPDWSGGFGDDFNPNAGNGVIAAGGDLYAVIQGDGSLQYHVVYEWEGLRFSYSIGDQEALASLFPDADRVFGGRFTVNQQQWSGLDTLALGGIDERLGDPTPIARELNEALRTFGFESMPDWLRNDRQAMQILAQGALEGFSAGRIMQDLSQTTGFRERFGAWEWAMTQSGGDALAAMQLYTQRESSLKNALSRFRGPSANLDNAYLADLLQIGWTVEAMTPILAAEEQLRADPAVFHDINRLLAAEGLNQIGPVGAIALLASQNQTAEQAAETLASIDLTELLGGNSPSQVFDLINDAMTLSALEDQGFVGLDLAFVRQLRTETGGILTKEGVDRFAQTAAINVLRFGPDIDFGRYGLDENDVISAAASRAAPSGKTSAEVNEIMGRILRERQQAAQGFDAFSGFVNESGRLQIRGLEGL